jgi:hypothetical protein
MSLVHLHKSVLTFHIKEILEDPNGHDSALLGLGAIAVGTLAVPAMLEFGRPVVKSLIKAGLPRSQSSEYHYRGVEAKFPQSGHQTVKNPQNH